MVTTTHIYITYCGRVCLVLVHHRCALTAEQTITGGMVAIQTAECGLPGVREKPNGSDMTSLLLQFRDAPMSHRTHRPCACAVTGSVRECSGMPLARRNDLQCGARCQPRRPMGKKGGGAAWGFPAPPPLPGSHTKVQEKGIIGIRDFKEIMAW